MNFAFASSLYWPLVPARNRQIFGRASLGFAR